MNIITIRTDKPESEIGIYQQATPLAYYTWNANRQLAETIHKVIEEQLTQQNLEYKDINAIVFYKGPGSFTGLRIGASVANALASSLNVSIVGETGYDWISDGISRLSDGENDKIVVPEYGSEPNITKPKK